MADDFLASSTTRSRGIVRVMEGASNVMFKNLNIVGFAATSEGFWSSTSTKGPLIVDGFSSTDGPDKAFRITGAGKEFGGGIMLSNSDPIFRNMIISNNIGDYGGGMFFQYSNPIWI